MLKRRTKRGLKFAIQKMRLLGLEKFGQVVKRQTDEENTISKGIELAEQKFFASIQKTVEERKALGKLTQYDSDFYE